MPNTYEITRSIDIEDAVRSALSEKFDVYCRPLPAKFKLPSLLVQTVGGVENNTIDNVDISLDARAKDEGSAYELLRNAIAFLKVIAKEQTTPIRHVSVNTSGSWGSDPVRPDLALCTARLTVTVHQEKTTI